MTTSFDWYDLVRKLSRDTVSMYLKPFSVVAIRIMMLLGSSSVLQLCHNLAIETIII